MISKKKKLIRWLKVLILVYCTIGIALYYLQEVFLFHPTKLPPEYVFHFNNRFEEMKVAVNKTDTLSFVKFYPSDSLTKGVVIYYHGNMKNIEHYSPYVKIFLNNGYEVWMGDYPGFGKTNGLRTEENMYHHARIIYGMAAAKYGSDSIIIYGKSLGTGIAAYVASYSPAKALVLETPYYSIPSLFSHYAFIYPVKSMSNYKIPAYQYIQEIKYPIIIFHGTGDDVIPYKNARSLLPFLKPRDKFITIKDGGHNTLTHSPQYAAVMDSLLR
ncbi:MAG: alpha/beta fold hydrolase [Ferruginibacter sp.]